MPKNLYRGIYLCLGYPNLEQSLECLRILSEHKNVDFIELGLPFSDPVADGKVIAQAAQSALQEAQKNGITPQNMLTKAMETLQTQNQKHKQKDIYLMTYANMIYNLLQQYQGFNQLALDGLIIPDLPLKEQDFFAKRGVEHPIIPFATPESTTQDLSFLASTQAKQRKEQKRKAKFVYFVAVRGITGAKTNFQSNELRQKYLAVCHAIQNGTNEAHAQNTINNPVILGFGIRGKAEIQQVAEFADGYVIGTAAVEIQDDLKAYQNFIDSLQF